MLWQRILAAAWPSRHFPSRRPADHNHGCSERRRLTLESLELRYLLSATPARPAAPPAFHPTIVEIAPQGSASPVGRGYSPSQIRHAYGLDQVLFGSVQGDGSGQTIAII